ncbi:flippase [Thiomicrolovo sulfuroxydans]|uniref:flippase n=1 Tax=Thiomicrolovo sulfuroxydans TaxID=2894755 RepID=UPI0021084942|nr:flippase [Sulfurimonas sp. HSL-3221]
MVYRFWKINLIKKLNDKLSRDRHLGELLKGSIVTFFLKVLGVGFGYVLTLLIARLFGADNLGLYTISITFLNILVLLGVFGFDNALVKFIAGFNARRDMQKTKEVFQKAYAISIPISLFLSAILFVLAEKISLRLFNNEQLTIFLQITSIGIVPFVLLKINSAFFRGLKMILQYSLFENVLISLLAVLIMLFLVMWNKSPEMIIGAYVCALFIVYLLSYRKTYNILSRIGTHRHTLTYRQLLDVSFPMLLASSVVLIMTWTDIIMLGVFKSEEDVGIYSVVVKLAGLTSITLMAVNSIAAPKFSECFQNNDLQGLKHIAQKSTKLLFFATIPLILILTMFSEFFLSLFGEKFLIGKVALIMLLIGSTVNALSGSVGLIMQMTGNQKQYQNVIIFATIVNIILNYYFIPIFDINGAAFASMISMIIWNISLVYLIKKKFGFLTLFVPLLKKEL